MSLINQRIGPFSLGPDGPHQSLEEAIPIKLDEGTFLSIQCVIEGATSGSNPVDIPVGAWRLYAAGDDSAPPIRFTPAEYGARSLASIAPAGNTFVNALASIDHFPFKRGRLYYDRTSGGDVARATLWITTGPWALAKNLQPLLSAASLRGPMRSESLAITVTTASRTFNVPDGTGGQPLWKGRIVNLFADGGDVYIQLSTGLDASVDEASVAQEALASGRITLTPAATPNGCWKIPAGQWLPVPFGEDVQTFALKGSAACKLRTHVAES